MWPFVRSQWYCAASRGGPPSAARGRGWCRAAILPGQFPHLFTVCDLVAGQTAAEEQSAAATRPSERTDRSGAAAALGSRPAFGVRDRLPVSGAGKLAAHCQDPMISSSTDERRTG